MIIFIDNIKPTPPGALTLSEKKTTSIILNFGDATIESNFFEYKIFYKQGAGGVTESDSEHNSGDDPNLADINFFGAATTTIGGLTAGTQYVFNIWAYDSAGNKASSTAEFTVTTNYVPENPVSLSQYKNDGVTLISNGGWTNEDNIKLEAQVNDSDISEIITVYFELATSTDAFTGDYSSPCSASASWDSCSGKVWSITSAVGNYSSTPYTAVVNPTSIPDSAVGYKWQVMACDDNNACSSWVDPGIDPNFKIDTNPPTTPGNLSENSKTSTTITLNFGSVANETNFAEYKIFYKQGASGVTESDSEYNSGNDPNLADINFFSAATTTIGGLTAGTQYVFNIWAYDQAGNKANGTEVAVTTNNPPEGSFYSISQRPDGLGAVDISIQVDDPDNNDEVRAKIEYEAGSGCSFLSPLKTFLDETDGNATSTYGDAKIENDNEYQVGNSSGWIITSPGANTVNFDWLSASDLPAGDGIYCLRLTTNDGTDDQAVSATTTLIIDNVNPTAPGNLSMYSKTGDSITLAFGIKTTETNFLEYKIFYKEGAGTVTESDNLHIDPDLSNIDYNFTSTTTVSGLNPSSEYSFKIFAYDAFGHKSSSEQVAFSTNNPPTGNFNSAAQKTDGTGTVDISIEVNDLDSDNAKAKIEYEQGSGCQFSSSLKAYINETDANTTADFGDPKVSNGDNYQVGNASGWIITSSGSNTVNFDWNSKSDIPNGDNIYCLRLTVNDGTDNQLILATTTILVDNTNPTIPGDLSVDNVSALDVTLAFGSATADTNFSEYKIYYKQGTSGVTESDSEFSQLDDLNLGAIDFNSAALTTIAGLNQSTDYVFNLWAYDSFGNKASSSNEISTTTISILSATWRENEDTPDPTTGSYIDREEPIRLRISAANIGDWEALNYQYLLEYGVKEPACSDITAWTSVPATASTEHFEMVASDYFDNMSITSAKFNNSEGYSFVNGFIIENPSNISNNITLSGNEYTEIEYALQATVNSVAGETYCFRITNNGQPLDLYGQYPEFTLSPPPTASFNYALQKNDGSGTVDISIEVSDNDGDLSRAKIEYVEGADCNFSSPLDPTLDETDENITADYGDPNIDNNFAYQIGTSTAKIITQYGSNTVGFDWDAATDLPGADNTYCLRVTANNYYDDQAYPATTTLIIDHVNPTQPGDLTENDATSNSITLGFGAPAADTNFYEYRIYYKEGLSGVTESDTLHGSSTDPNLGFMNYNGAVETTIFGLNTNTQHVFRIWAYDSFGNKAFSSGELVTTIRYEAKSENWRWYYDQYNETPVSPIADENTAPTNIAKASKIKLRLGLREIEGITGENIKIRLQYSTMPDFSSNVNFVGEIGSTTALWTYADGVDNDDGAVSSSTLANIMLGATHNESGISASAYDHAANTIAEWEFTIMNNGAPDNTVYYFRAYDYVNDEAVLTNTDENYPSLATEAQSMTFSSSGISSGTNIEGIITDIDSTSAKIPFGALNIGSVVEGAYRFTVNTNAGSGYQLFTYQRQNFINNYGNSIIPISATNESPAAWPVNPDPSCFGYHTSDDTLSGGSPSRFLPDNSYAKLETTMKEVGYNPFPVENENIDLVYKIEIGSADQPAGDYETEIVYILVPTF